MVAYLVYNLVVYTVVALTSGVGNNTLHYLPVVFYLLKFLSSISKYTTSATSRGVVYKLKSKVISTYLPHSQIIYKSLIRTSEMPY